MKNILLAGACALAMSGCATITRGTSNQVQLRSNPEEARASTSLGQSCQTPCTITVGRKDEFAVKFEKDGYEPQTVEVKTQLAGSGAAGFAGNVLIGGVVGMGADVVIIDKALPRLRELENLFGGRVTCLYATGDVIAREVTAADLVIGAVLQPGASAPKLVTREMIRAMPNGAAVVDVSIDQGGCIATSHPTTHDDPTFIIDGVVHYCVANMPGVVARTATLALNNATLPFVHLLAEKGLDALTADPHLRNGLNVHEGRLTNLAVARDQDRPFTEPLTALGAPGAGRIIPRRIP